MGLRDRGRQLTDGRDTVDMRELDPRVTKPFGRQCLLGEITGDRECGVHPLRLQLQRRIRHYPVFATAGIIEPFRKADLFSRETSIQIRFDHSIERFSADDIANMHPDDLLGRYSPNPLIGWIGPAIPVIPADDGYEVR